MEKMSQVYFSNTSEKQNGETQVCDCEVEEEGLPPSSISQSQCSNNIADGVLAGALEMTNVQG